MKVDVGEYKRNIESGIGKAVFVPRPVRDDDRVYTATILIR
jgi:hypothetical protein